MKASILIVEDEKDIADVLIMYLEREMVQTSWVETGEEALTLLPDGAFDLIILDINLPGIDGFETLRKIRQQSEIPVIIVSAREEDVDMILGFGVGADDYVVKPFSPGVLTARIRAHLRRINDSESGKTDIIQFGNWELDRTHLILKQKGVKINLSPREMDLLVFLSENDGKAFSQEELYEKIWGNTFGDLSTVSVHIQRLRKKLEVDSSNPRFIRTRYGFGYFFQGE
jgi:DNA-binding response OmpR family regulator